MSPIFQGTRNTVRQAIGRDLGLMLGTFAVHGGTLGEVETRDFHIRNSDQGTGLHLYIYTGNDAAQVRLSHSAAAPGSPGDTATIYVAPSLGNPSTNSSFELWERFDPRDVNSLIDGAVRRVASRILDGKEDFAIQLNDRLGRWGSFDDWPDGASAAPYGFTLGANGSVAREGSTKYSGRYSCALSAVLNQAAQLESDDIPGFPKFAGHNCTVKAKVYTNTASRVRVSLLDGVNTWYSGYHDGTGGWDGNDGSPLAIEGVTLAENLSQLRIQLRIESGAAMTAYWGKVWMSVGESIFEFELPISNSTDTGFAFLSEIWTEGGQDGVFNVKIPPDWYEITPGATASSRKILRFAKGKADGLLASGRQLRLVGQAHPRLPSSDTSTLEVDVEYVRLACMVDVMDAIGYNEMDRSRRDRWDRQVAGYLQTIHTYPHADSVPVEAW